MKMLKRLLCLILPVTIFSFSSFCQNVSISDDGSPASPSAMLEIKVSAANKKGLLIPRMTSSQRTAIASPAKGLLVYDSTSKSFWFHNGTAWTPISSGGPNSWQINGSHIYNNNSGNVGIGVTSPKSKLQVAPNKSVIFGDDSLNSAAGAQFVWFAKKGAVRFRTQFSSGTYPTPSPYNYAQIGENSLAIGESTAAGAYAIGIGNFSNATGSDSYAQGFSASAVGVGSMARGAYVYAGGDNSYASGFTVISTGLYSFGQGEYLNVPCMSCFAIGKYNDTIAGSSPGLWVDKDPIFMVGNGSVNGQINSLTILKNGILGIGKNPVGDNAGWGMVQLRNVGGKDLLTLIQKTTNKRWGVSIPDAGDADLFLKYEGTNKGKFSIVNGAYTQLSDIRMKKDVAPIAEVLPLVMQLSPYKYHYLDNRSTDPLSYGFFAQDVQKLFPSFVSNMSSDGSQEHLGIDYNNFSVIGIKAIQEQQAIIQKQNMIITDQQQRINDLEKRMEIIEKLLTDAKAGL